MNNPGDREELRLALALNGGVSLAIWIGGVVHEINRLVRSAGVWAAATDLVDTDVRVDVIAGSSAGGINGAFLAAAMVYDRDLLPIRSLWIDKGGLRDLLRSPFESPMPSLMRGDAYFLPALRSAFEGLAAGTPRPVEEVPVNLTITTTVLAGTLTVRPDDFGSVIREVSHAEQFTFRRGPGIEPDDFGRPDAAARLALASRCTASFPGAFEPSFCAIGPADADADHPDMSGQIGLESSRFCVDGGVLVNKPVGPALRTIFGQRADRQVRRVLAYIVPDPGTVADVAADRRESPPTAARVITDSLVTLPRVESVGDALDFYSHHNDEVRKRRGARDALVVRVGPGTIENLAGELFGAYRAARTLSSCSYIGVEVGKAVTARPGGEELRWDRDTLVGALYALDLPWVPPPPTRGRAWHAVGPVWRWGQFPVERAGGIVLDLVRRAFYVAPFGSGERGELGRIRGEVHDLLVGLRVRRFAGARRWRDALPGPDRVGLLATQPGGGAALANELAGACRQVVEKMRADAQALGPNSPDAIDARRVAQLFADTGTVLSNLLGGGAELALGPPVGVAPSALGIGERQVLGAWSALAQGTPSELMRRLLAFEVLETAFGQNDLEVDQVVELVQVSAEGATPIDPARATAASKLAGEQLGHFGAFYKRSWRANDWMWGRLDGVTKLAQVLLHPARLRQLASGRPDLREAAKEAVLGPAGPDRDWLYRQVRWPALNAELAALVNTGAPVPEVLPELVAALARRLQLGVLREELGVVAAAVEQDGEDGALRTGSGPRFARAWRDEVGNGSAAGLAPTRVVELFAQCEVGAERVSDDVGSDLFTATASAALASSVSVAYDRRSGLGPLRLLARAIRGAVLVFFLLARNAAAGVSGAVINALLLGIGSTLVAVSLFVTEGVPGWLVGLGWLAVAGGLLQALTRSLAAVLAAAGAVALGWAVWVLVLGHPAPLASSSEGVPKAVSAFLLVGLVLGLGSLRAPGHRGRRRTRPARP